MDECNKNLPRRDTACSYKLSRQRGKQGTAPGQLQLRVRKRKLKRDAWSEFAHTAGLQEVEDENILWCTRPSELKWKD